MKKLYNKYFPTPSYLSMNPFSIDISDHTIKYGKLSVTSSGLSLSHFGKENIPDGVIVSGKVQKEDDFVLLLKKIKEQEKIQFIRASLPEEQTYLFSLSIAKTEKQNLRDVILFQIEEHIPLKAIDCFFDYKILSEDQENFLVEVVAIASSTMESYLSAFNKAGLVPLSFEAEAQAIARAIIPKGENKSIMIVDFGSSKTGVFIFKEGRIFLTTTLSIGGIDLTNMVAKTFSLSFEEAEKKKKDYGINTESEVKDIFPAVLNGLSVLRDELNKQVTYWDNHNTDNKKDKISKVILCGGNANLTGLSEYLELSMKINVENANAWVNILNIEKTIPEMPFEDSLSYTTIIGLSLINYLKSSESYINILPLPQKRKIKREYWMRFSTILFDMIALIVIISIVLLSPSYFLSKTKEDTVKESLESFNKENSELINNDIDKIASDINKKLSILDKGKSSFQVSDEIVKDILLNQVEGISFSQILFDRQKLDHNVLEIRGIATSRDTLRNFKNILDSNPKYLEVNLPVSNFLERENLNFLISIKLK